MLCALKLIQMHKSSSLNSKSWKNKQGSVILIACSQLCALCAHLSFLVSCTDAACSLGSFTDARVFAQHHVRARALRKEFEGGGGVRLTLSRHETVLLSCIQPHETPQVGADAHGQSALLNKSTTGGDAETQQLKQEQGKGASRLASSVFSSPESRKDFLSL